MVIINSQEIRKCFGVRCDRQHRIQHFRIHINMRTQKRQANANRYGKARESIYIYLQNKRQENRMITPTHRRFVCKENGLNILQIILCCVTQFV